MSLMNKVLLQTARQTEVARLKALHAASGAAIASLRSKSGSGKPRAAAASKGAAKGKRKRRVVKDGETFLVEDIDTFDGEIRDGDDDFVGDIDHFDGQIR